MKTVSAGSASKRNIWAGRILTGMVALVLLGSGIAKIAGAPKMVQGLIRAGIPEAAILPIAVLELSCLALYLIPRTTVLATFLLTGYFGGATVTHIIGRENWAPPLLIGLMIWGGAWFRVPELRNWLPLRRIPEEAGRLREPGNPAAFARRGGDDVKHQTVGENQP
jgi:hypothetical protein